MNRFQVTFQVAFVVGQEWAFLTQERFNFFVYTFDVTSKVALLCSCIFAFVATERFEAFVK